MAATQPTTPETTPATISVEAAAQMLGIGRSLAYELARQGRIPALRLGRRLVIPRAALLNLLAAGLNPSASR